MPATAANWRTTRFPTWALAQALGQAVHPSVVTVCIVQKHERPSKLKQGRDARVTASGLTSIASIPTSHRIVLVDDLVTTGSSVIAMDRLLDNRVHGVITVGVNDTSSCVHAATLRGFTIEYDDAAPQLPSRPSLVLAN